MRLLHYLEIENFKRFGEKQRIELDHPTVLIGPNNCGKTSAIQALALWSQAVKSWFDARRESAAQERTATALNRLAIVSVPVQRTRFFWHDTRVQKVPLTITVGVQVDGEVVPLTMNFTHRGDELVYCSPTEEARAHSRWIEVAARINTALLYPMSGLESEEPILQPGRVEVLLGQGQTAQVLRNLCLMVDTDHPEDWQRIIGLMKRLFQAELGRPTPTGRGAIDLRFRQPGVKELLDLSLAGRGFQQMLLIFAYLFWHRQSVLLIDEPDAHLEILRQKQVYVLLRDLASELGSQVVMVTHSEVILEEALENNLTLILDGKTDDLAKKAGIRNSLRHFGADHYLRARERGYVLYVEGGTDIDMLRGLAERLDHPVHSIWDEPLNCFYVADNFPLATVESELERVEGGFGITPREHFFSLRAMLPKLRGLAILDNDDKRREPRIEPGFEQIYWRRYEAENYFVTPDLLRRFALQQYGDLELFGGFRLEIEATLDGLVLEKVFADDEEDFRIWKESPPDPARLLWEARTERLKLSSFAEDFFRRLAIRVGQPMILRKGELHRLLPLVDPRGIPKEVSEKLDALVSLFRGARLEPQASR